jgi:hypothetical protein
MFQSKPLLDLYAIYTYMHTLVKKEKKETLAVKKKERINTI